MLTLAMLINAGFGMFHLLFWWLFNWTASLSSSGTVNAGIVQLLNLCLTFVFFAVAIELSMVASAGPLLLAGCLFWALRAALQPLHFPMRHRASLALSVPFVSGSIIHGLAHPDA